MHSSTNVGSTTAELIIASLERHGVDTVFGIPGVHTLALYDALRQSGIRHVLARHEQGVGFMADGYARATGKPGVAFVISGPGVTNIATPVGEAFTDSSPVMVISSNVATPYIDSFRGDLHDIRDQRGVMATFTKWNTRVERPADATAVMDLAFQQLNSGRPQPVHIEIPTDVLSQRTRCSLPSDVAQSTVSLPDPEAIRQAADWLASGLKTVIYCGGGAVSSGASANIELLAAMLGAPVVTSIMGKGAIPGDSPWSLGNCWTTGNLVDEMVQQADQTLVIGSKLGVQATEGFSLHFPGRMIRIDIDPQELEKNCRPDLAICADANLAVESILRELSGREIAPGFQAETIAACREASIPQAWGYAPDRQQYIDALRSAIPRDGILVNDMTCMSYLACVNYPVYEPRTFLFPQGYGTLGFALPAAIGAKIGQPDRAVVAVAGDGGFQYTMPELAVAIQEKLTLPIVVFNDSTYTAVKLEQAGDYHRRFIGVDLINPDFVALAAAYGIPGVRAMTPNALQDALSIALGQSGPTLIEVPIESWAV